MGIITHIYSIFSLTIAYIYNLIARDISTLIDIPKFMIQESYTLSINNWSIVLPLLFFSLCIYWLSLENGRNWMKNYLIPVSFFSIMFLRVIANTLLHIQKNFTFRAVLELSNSFFVILFMGIVIFSYLIRSSPAKQAKGLLESFYPIFVVIFHLIGATLLATTTTSHYVPHIHLIGLILCVSGVTLNVASLWQLKSSFSIMVEVRKLVNTGVYRFFRHPLYTGEMTHLLGLCLLFNNPFAYSFFRVVLLMQVSRALLEERKLSRHLPEYQLYKQKTGFIFPKLNILSRLRPAKCRDQSLGEG